jgi:haloalkane dehalogenase
MKEGRTMYRDVPRRRTAEARFEGLASFPFEPHHAELHGLRMHYLDEGAAERGTMLLLHGEPTWSYLYRHVIPPLVAAGFRTIAPDMIGFGRSDKVTDPEWYTLEAHVTMLRALIDHLDLEDITLVCQDWGGPYGLVNATDTPGRFARLVILNTWLHHDGYEYTPALRQWHEISRSVDFSTMHGGFALPSADPIDSLQHAYRAPFDSPESQTGAYRWPWMLPFAHPVEGGADRQAEAFEKLARWDRPAHVIFGDSDAVFTPEWGRAFAAHIPDASFDLIEGAGHMVQEAGPRLAEVILRRIGEH